MAATNKLDAHGLRVGVIDPKETQPQGGAGAVAGDLDQKQLRALIGRRHPEYTEKKDHWDFLEETYEGGREWFDENIFRYVKEGDQEFADRKKRAYRFNHTREVVDLVDKYLFRQAVTRNYEDAPASVREFWERSTRNGLGIDDLSRMISKRSSISGRIGIVVDNNKSEGVVSKADAKKSGIGIYSYIVGPRQLLDYSFDEHGALNWILIEESYRDDTNPFTEAQPVEPRWRLWTKTDWRLFEERKDPRTGRKKIVQVDSGVHDLGEVPVILHDNIISDEEWYSSSLIDEIAYLDRAVANYLSNLDAIIQDQTFSQLAMPAQSLMPGEESYNKMVEMSTKRVFLYDGEGGGQPTYLSPDVKQAQLIVQAIQKIINEIYHTTGLAGERTKEDNSMGIDNSSGVAKAYDFDRVNSLLVAKADSLQLTENKINRLVALWSGETVKEPLVSYPDNFDVRGLYDEFDIAARLILIEAPDETRREQMRAVQAKLFPMASEKKKKELEAELKDWPKDPLEEAEALADIGANAAVKVAKAKPADAPKANKDKRQGQTTKDTK